MRRIGDLARANVWGAAFGTAASIALVAWWGEAGVVPALVVVAATALVTSTWYSRKVFIADEPVSGRQFKSELAELMTLGFAFMVSALLTTGAGYAARLIVLDGSGLEAAGLYQAAWTLAGLYVGFVLQAMGADFYPRLVGASEKHDECNRMVNDQAQVSMLLAGPGVMATLTLASMVLVAFYSSAFAAAADLLRWTCLGMLLRVVSWPMGFIIVAKGARQLFLATEVLWATAFVGLTWCGVKTFGLQGAGIAFFASYVLHCLMIYPAARRLTGFRWTRTSLVCMSFYVVLAGLTQTAFMTQPLWLATVAGCVATSLAGAYSLRQLLALASSDELPPGARRLLSKFRLIPGTAASDPASP